MKDLGIALWIIKTGTWKYSGPLNDANYSGLFIWKSTVSVLPYWIRIWQCIIRYRETQMFLYAINSFKQAAGFFAGISGILLYKNET